MAKNAMADASPEKRLFISLITRDISLAEAVLDLVDNSINAALEPLAAGLKTADDYDRLLKNTRVKPKVEIALTVNSSKITISDNASGIPLDTAQKHVFKFGRDTDEVSDLDRLSVYGIGLKRAIFKCGNKISIISDHIDGGFELNLNVRAWEKLKALPWTFELQARPPKKVDRGTQIVIAELHDDVHRRLSDGLFLPQLRDRLARTYSFFIGRVVEIRLNGSIIEKEAFEIGSNYTSQKFQSGTVSCNVTAGIAVTAGDTFKDRNAGWYVFCNGRALLFADKTTLTGWGGGGLPIFHPKFRPFLGTVFFVSTDTEALPWTTTKASVNEESAIWQEAKRRMVLVGRVVTGFLDKVYSENGTEVARSDIQDLAGKPISIFSAAIAQPRAFKAPAKAAPKTTKIQYDAKTSDIKRIEAYLRQKMGGSKVGRYTFDYFLKNEVGDKD